MPENAFSAPGPYLHREHGRRFAVADACGLAMRHVDADALLPAHDGADACTAAASMIAVVA